MTLLPFDEQTFDYELAELDEWRRKLDTRPVARTWEGRLRRDLEAEAVAASTSMEGVPVTVDEVRRILAGERPITVSEEDAALVRGYREAMEYIQRRADDDTFVWSPELIKSIQDRVLAGDYRKGAGRYGTGRWIVDSATGEIIFTPPPDEVAPKLVEDACTQMETWNAHPALRSAWIHVAIAGIHPFKDGNGRASRVLASLAMYRGGFKRPEFCSLEEWWGRHKVEYYASFRCLGTEWNPNADVTPFVSSHLNAQLSQVRALDLRARVNRQIWQALEQLVEDAGAPDRAANALWEAFNGREIVPSYYRRLVDVSEGTATNDFRTLAAARLLEALGRTKSRRFVAGRQLFGSLAGALRIDLQEPDRASIGGVLATRLLNDRAALGQASTTSGGVTATMPVGSMDQTSDGGVTTRSH